MAQLGSPDRCENDVRRCHSERSMKIETFSPRNHVHAFRLEHPSDVDSTFVEWMREAYAVGEQRHL
jgi:hypothetical protein